MRANDGRRAWVVAAVAMGMWGASVALAQGLSPQAFGLPAEFGMAAPANARQLGLGAALSCLSDGACANPAFIPLVTSAEAGTRLSLTSLDNGPRVSSYLSHSVCPLRPGCDGLQLLNVTVESDGPGTSLPGPLVASADLSEDAYVLDYGRRLNAQVTVGAGILGYEDSEFSLVAPGGASLASLYSRTRLGLRLGGAWEYQPGDFCGLTYGYGQNRVDASGALLGAARRVSFRSHQAAVGLTHHLRPELLALAEYSYGTARSSEGNSYSHRWHFGLEYRPLAVCALRAGLADGHFTCGLGVEGERQRLGYAYLRDWNQASTGALLGGSTTHVLEATTAW